MKKLVDGFLRFRTELYPQQEAFFRRLAADPQHPLAMFITCADSRVIPELITQADPGDLFVCRNVGNIVPPYAQFTGGVSTAIEYAVMVLGVRHIIVCGHSDCGAMKATMQPDTISNLHAVSAWLRHAYIARQVVDENYPGCGCEEKLHHLTEENVIAQLDHLRTHPSVAARLARGDLGIHGWVYDIEHCTIRAFSAEQNCFVPLEQYADMPQATPRARFAARMS